MPLNDFLFLCAFLLSVSFLIGLLVLLCKLEQTERKRCEERKAKEKADFEAYVQNEIENALLAHFCGCHCNETTAIPCEESKKTNN